MEKESVIKAVNEFPQEVDLEALFERPVFLDKVQKGLIQVENGETVPHDEVVASFRSNIVKISRSVR